MLLTIDVGNTQTVLGTWQGDTLEARWRTATLRAKTRCRVAVVSPEMLDRGSLERLAASRAVT